MPNFCEVCAHFCVDPWYYNPVSYTHLDVYKRQSTEIDDLETYMKSSQYIEDVAKSKLGLTYKNEIIFKEKK